MEIEELTIAGSWVFTPTQFGDDRGKFMEFFKQDLFQEITGRSLELAQGNCSVSSKGVVRGIHFADVPPGQAKYVTCLAGAILDVVVDIRVGSVTFGQWAAVELNTESRRAVFLSEGLGHGFAALTPNATVAYLCSTGYNPKAEHEVHPLDPDLAIDWRVPADEAELSEKDAKAPTLAQALEQGLLPTV